MNLKQTPTNIKIKVNIGLFLVVFFWGFSFIMIDVANRDLSPFNLNSMRFLIAFALSAIVFRKRLTLITRETVIWSFVLALALSAMYTCTTLGVKYTTLSNCAFLCQSGVIITPFLSRIVNKVPLQKKVFFVATICIVGIALITLTDGFSLDPKNFKGDIFSIMAGIGGSTHVVLTERLSSKRHIDTFQIGIFQLGATGLITLIMSFIFEKPHLPSAPNIWFSVVMLAIFCTGYAIIMQTIAQRYTSASHISIVFSLEPVSAGIFAYILLGETMSFQGYMGALLMMIGIFMMEIDFDKLKKRFKKT